MDTEVPTESGPRRDRRIVWALSLGGIGVAVAIAALLLAVSAKNATNTDATVAKAVRVEAAREIGGIRMELRRNVTTATTVLRRLQLSQARAKRTRAALAKEANANKAGVAGNAAAIETLQGQVATLQDQVATLNDEVAANTADIKTLSSNQQALVQSVDKLKP